MVKNILIVDDDREMLLALREGLNKYQDTFTVRMASDGREAVQVLETAVVSLVVTDLKMPHMDGFELLAHVMQHYPEIPVIIITGYSTSELERLALAGGAVGYIAKPFLIENLAHQILTTLRKESEGGTLHSVSSGIFLQLMEMEQKTCTIRLENKQNGRKGVLFFSKGELFDARVKDSHGKAAAYEIFAWDEVNLSIQNGCALKKNLIRQDIQSLMLESMRRKDESRDAQAGDGTMDAAEARARRQEQMGRDLRDRVERAIGPRCEAEYIRVEERWEKRIERFRKAGKIFALGRLLAGFIDIGEQKDYVLVPGQRTAVLKVDPKCPRDKILRVLTD
jgi:CheY-like chemotaxis protein